MVGNFLNVNFSVELLCLSITTFRIHPKYLLDWLLRFCSGFPPMYNGLLVIVLDSTGLPYLSGVENILSMPSCAIFFRFEAEKKITKHKIDYQNQTRTGPSGYRENRGRPP